MQSAAKAAPAPYTIDDMAEEHRRAVIDIFNYYVENSFAAYPDTKVPYDFLDHLLAMCRGYCALVLKSGEQVIGFALLRPYHPVSTLQRTAEVSYFIAPGHTHRGVGKVVLDKLTEVARGLGVDNLLASVSSWNQESLSFHRKSGFVECGRFRHVGRKMGRDFDIVWFQKRI